MEKEKNSTETVLEGKVFSRSRISTTPNAVNPIVTNFLDNIRESMKEKEGNWFEKFEKLVFSVLNRKEVNGIASFHESESALSTMVENTIGAFSPVATVEYDRGLFELYRIVGEFYDSYVLVDRYEADDYYLFSLDS